MANVKIHFDGDIVTDHKISMRALGKTLKHLQNSMDRAYIELKFGQLWKHSRLKTEFYKDVELLVQNSYEGGYILDFLASNRITKNVINRVISAMNEAILESQEDGYAETLKIIESAQRRKMQIENNLVEPKDYTQLLEEPDNAVSRKYADRAIVREINEILSIIRSSESGESYFELTLSGDRTSTFYFNREKAKRFHLTITQRQLGDPIIYQAIIKSMDRDQLKGKILNTENEKNANIIFVDEASFQEVIPYFEKKEIMKFYGSPFIEYGTFDPIAGDIYFLRVF